MAPEVISRKDALAKGLKRYFTGKPCTKGHVCQRVTSEARCCDCLNEKNKRRDPEKLRQGAAKYYYDNRTGVLEKKKLWRQENLELAKNRVNRWHEKNSKSLLRKTYEYRRLNPDKAKEWAKRSRKKNVEVVQIGRRRYSARKRNAIGSHTVLDVREIMKWQKGKCAFCRKRFDEQTKPTLDHIVPLIKGGSHDRTNIQFLCVSCNSSKKDFDQIDFARRHGRLL